MFNQVDIMIMSGVDDGKLHSFNAADLPDQRITIGRGDDNLIVVPYDVAVSRNHAVIYQHEHMWWLEDLNSKNGTYIERDTTLLNQNERIRSVVPLEDGQLFRIGKTWMRFQTYEWQVNA